MKQFLLAILLAASVCSVSAQTSTEFPDMNPKTINFEQLKQLAEPMKKAIRDSINKINFNDTTITSSDGTVISYASKKELRNIVKQTCGIVLSFLDHPEKEAELEGKMEVVIKKFDYLTDDITAEAEYQDNKREILERLKENSDASPAEKKKSSDDAKAELDKLKKKFDEEKKEREQKRIEEKAV